MLRVSKQSGKVTGVACLGLLMIWVIATAGIAWVVELLWNWLVPLLFHGPQITYWEAVGVLFLLSLLTSLFK